MQICLYIWNVHNIPFVCTAALYKCTKYTARTRHESYKKKVLLNTRYSSLLINSGLPCRQNCFSGHVSPFFLTVPGFHSVEAPQRSLFFALWKRKNIKKKKNSKLFDFRGKLTEMYEENNFLINACKVYFAVVNVGVYLSIYLSIHLPGI